MRRSVLFLAAILGAALFAGCGKSEDAGEVLPGTTVGPNGKPLTADEAAKAPKADGAFDELPMGGPGGKKAPK